MLCSNLMWSYGKLGTTHEALMEALDQRTLQLLPSLQPQSVVRPSRSSRVFQARWLWLVMSLGWEGCGCICQHAAMNATASVHCTTWLHLCTPRLSPPSTACGPCLRVVVLLHVPDLRITLYNLAALLIGLGFSRQCRHASITLKLPQAPLSTYYHSPAGCFCTCSQLLRQAGSPQSEQ